MSQFFLRTDDEGHRWEIGLLEDGMFEHRREGRTNWEAGWPASLPPQDNENSSVGANLVPKQPDAR